MGSYGVRELPYAEAMALTSELADPDSPVRRFFEDRFPDVGPFPDRVALPGPGWATPAASRGTVGALPDGV